MITDTELVKGKRCHREGRSLTPAPELTVTAAKAAQRSIYIVKPLAGKLVATTTILVDIDHTAPGWRLKARSHLFQLWESARLAAGELIALRGCPNAVLSSTIDLVEQSELAARLLVRDQRNQGWRALKAAMQALDAWQRAMDAIRTQMEITSGSESPA